MVQCEIAPSGHMMMPVDHFAASDNEEKNGGLELKEVVLQVQTKVQTPSSWQTDLVDVKAEVGGDVGQMETYFSRDTNTYILLTPLVSK